jgi:hypothetical protein
MREHLAVALVTLCVIVGMALFLFVVLQISKLIEAYELKKRDANLDNFTHFDQLFFLGRDGITPPYVKRLTELAETPKDCMRASVLFASMGWKDEAELSKEFYTKWDRLVDDILLFADRDELIDLLPEIRLQSSLYKKAIKGLLALDEDFDQSIETWKLCSPEYPELKQKAYDKAYFRAMTVEDWDDLDKIRDKLKTVHKCP